MASSLATLSAPLVPPLLGLLTAVLGAYVALDLGQRARRLQGKARDPWLIAAAAALAVACWSAQVLALSSIFDAFDTGFEPGLTILAAVLGFAGALLGLRRWLAAAPSSRTALAGAALLATGVLMLQVLLLGAVGLTPRVRWHPGWLLLAWLVAAGGLAGAAVVGGGPPRALPAIPPLRAAAAALLAAAAVLGAQALGIEAAQLQHPRPLPDATLIRSPTLAIAAGVGSLELLLVLLLASRIEHRVRSAPERRCEPDASPFRDPLTGLLTRAPFEGTIAQALQRADARQAQAALLLVGVDGFRQVNDSYGHQVGDRVLAGIAQRLRELVALPQLARLGGDEFLILVDGDGAAQQAQALAAKLLDAVARPFSIDGQAITLSASIGVAVYPQHGAVQALISHAGVAARAAKAAGGATHALFEPGMIRDTHEQAELLRDLRVALARKQLALYYQPKVHAPSGQITGVEALLRWHHPQRGLVSPAVFIPLAEHSGLIQSLGAWVIDEACRQARQWRDAGLRMRVAINLSPHQVRDADLALRVEAALRTHQIKAELLTCEITEAIALEDTEATFQAIQALAALGVHISIADFGSGYSSLAYLRRLPAHELKIDRSCVLDLETSPEACQIAQAVVKLAQALKLKVVAEGVETDGQYRILRGLGCDELQGFLFAAPMTAQAVALWATDDAGPRSLQFRESLFQPTGVFADV